MKLELDIELVSKHTIIPSSPTPRHLIHYQLSSLDQTAHPIYNSLVFFYFSEDYSDIDITNLSCRLKISLSETLTRFYPLAGRLRDNVTIDCNDHGCMYLETRVNSPLIPDHYKKNGDVIENPNLHELRKLVPFAIHDMGKFILGIQFNVFECGGVAIGVCLSHKAGDAFSLHLFMKAWAAICRGEVDVPYPVFIPYELFVNNNKTCALTNCLISPISNNKVPRYEPNTLEPYMVNVTKRFVFKSDTINTLKAKYAKSRHRPLSRAEALTAFLWSRFAAITDHQVRYSFPHKTSMVSSLVNLRPKFTPPLPENCFGNLYGLEITTLPHVVTTDKVILDLIPKMRESTRKINEKYVKKHVDTYLSSLENIRDEISLNFTTLCGLTLYDADFGWGKPMWVGFPAWPNNLKNVVAFVDTKLGDGVEAYVTLSKEDMAKFEEKIRQPSDLITGISRM